MDDVREAVVELLADKPEAKPALKALLSEDENGPWTFDDLTLDSGLFGEIVSRGIVEEEGDGYRLTDPDAVRVALSEKPIESETQEGEATTNLQKLLPSEPDFATVLTVCGALIFAVVVRVYLMINSVFREGRVVLAGNDPWAYRYYIEQLLMHDVSPLALGTLPQHIDTGNYLFIVLGWWLSLILGGTTHDAGLALAVAPVIAAVLTIFVVYMLAVAVTADRRIGIASILLLALTPIHAYRTALGFGDHHAFDFLLVALTAYGLTLTVNERCDSGEEYSWSAVLPNSKRVWSGALLVGLGISAQSLAWVAGPLLSVPVGLYVVYRAVSDVRANASPLGRNIPVVVGIAVATILTLLSLIVWNWPLSWIRVSAPALLFGGSIVILLVAEFAHRRRHSSLAVLAAIMMTATGSVAAVWLAIPTFASTIERFVRYLFRTGESQIAETLSLFSGDLGGFVGPLLVLGFTLYLGFPDLLVTLRKVYQEYAPTQAILGIYTTYFLILSVVQLRFAGHLSLFIAVFAGMGFVRLAKATDVLDSRPDDQTSRNRTVDHGQRQISPVPVPDPGKLKYLAVLFLLVSSISLVQIPVKQEQIATDNKTYQTATWIQSHASASGDPSTAYVFSNWGQNRVYNYFVNGRSGSYSYARAYYSEFAFSSNESRWAERLRNRNAYIVTKPTDMADSMALHNRIHQRHGSESAQTEGLSHFRTIYADNDRVVTVPVTGATIVGTVKNGSSVTVSTEVAVQGTNFTYNRTVESNPYGLYSVTVPYPGTYTVHEGVSNISASDVTEGGRVVLHNRDGTAHWPFDGSGDVAYDRVGGFNGEISGASRVSGVNGSALSFDGTDDSVVIGDNEQSALIDGNSSVTVSFWIRGNLEEASSEYPTVFYYQSPGQRVVFSSRPNGFGVTVGDETESRGNFGIDDSTFERWTRVTAVVDTQNSETRLYRNDTLVSVSNITGIDRVGDTGTLYVGSGIEDKFAPAQIDDLRIYSQAVDEAKIQELAETE